MIGHLFDAGHSAPDDLLSRVTPACELDTEVNACA
jgi:hypothetical protein